MERLATITDRVLADVQTMREARQLLAADQIVDDPSPLYWSDILRAMDVGDAFRAPIDKRGTLASLVCQFSARTNPARFFATKAMQRGGETYVLVRRVR